MKVKGETKGNDSINKPRQRQMKVIGIQLNRERLEVERKKERQMVGEI